MGHWMSNMRSFKSNNYSILFHWKLNLFKTKSYFHIRKISKEEKSKSYDERDDYPPPTNIPVPIPTATPFTNPILPNFGYSYPPNFSYPSSSSILPGINFDSQSSFNPLGSHPSQNINPNLNIDYGHTVNYPSSSSSSQPPHINPTAFQNPPNIPTGPQQPQGVPPTTQLQVLQNDLILFK